MFICGLHYVGTEKIGKLYIYPPIPDLPADYDPRARIWYKSAVNTKKEVILSDPYLDVASKK